MLSYKDLDIYKLAHNLAVKVHKMTLRELSKFEMYEEGSQIRRSSKSIVSNIVEKKHLVLLFDTKSMKNKEQFESFLSGYEELGAKIMKFTQAVERGHLVPKS